MNTTTSEGTNVKVTAPSETTLNNASNVNPAISMIQGARQGTIPTNDQIQQTISTTQSALDQARTENQLSTKGQVLVDDAQQLLGSLNNLIIEKNNDEKLQRIYANSATTGMNTAQNLKGADANVGKEDLNTMRYNARGMWDNGKSVATFAIRSSAFRDILLEMLDMFQTLIRTTQTKIAQQPGLGTDNLTNVASQMNNEQIISEQQKQALYDKFKMLLTQLGSRPEYYNAVDHIFQIGDQMSWKSQQIKSSTAVDALPSTTEVDTLWSDVKLFVEEFSGAGSMEELERRVYTLYQMMKNDPEATAWYNEFRVYTLDTIKNPQYLQDETRNGYGRSLIERGRIILQGKYRPQFSDIFDQAKLVLTNIKNDYSTQDFTTKLQKFGADFAFDANGRPDIFVMQESLGQMKGLLMPLISTHLSNLPIPKIEGSNPKYDFSVEGLILHVQDLLPEFVNIKTKTDTTMAVQRLATSKNSTKVVLEADKVRAQFKDMKFFYRRKHIPKIEDHGVADVDLSQGSGISIKIVWRLKSKTDEPFQLRLMKVKCNIDRLAITVKSAKHNILDKLATKLFAGTIKKSIANAVVNNIIKALTPLNAKLNDLFKRRPVAGMTEKLNTQMKSTLFTGESEDKSLLQKAKETVSTGVDALKSKKSTTGYYGTNPSYYAPYPTQNLMDTENILLDVEETKDTPITFVEKPQNKAWAFEWYEPTAYTVDPFTSDVKVAEGFAQPTTPYSSV